GGMDLIFPHHENEIAQSRAAGDGFARYWMHNGLLGLAGEKMSKSLGNSLLVTDVLRRVRAPELRYYLVQAHYRSLLEYSEDALEEAAAAYQRIERFVLRASEVLMGAADDDGAPGLPVSFRSAMDEDLAVPAALAAVHASIRNGNQALAAADKPGVRASLVQARAMLDVLGLDPLAPPWADAAGSSGPGAGDRLRDVLGSLVRLTLQQRDAARARRDYATADAIRDGLDEIGIQVEDTPEGPRWELKRLAEQETRGPAVPVPDGPDLQGRAAPSRASRARAPAATAAARSRARAPPRPPPCAPATPPSAARPPRPDPAASAAPTTRPPRPDPAASAAPTTPPPRPGPAARAGLTRPSPRRAPAAVTQARPGPPAGRRVGRGTPPSSSPAATRWWSRCGPPCPRPPCTWVTGCSTTSGSARPSSSPPTAAWPCSRPAPPNSTASPAARCTRAWRSASAPTTTRTP